MPKLTIVLGPTAVGKTDYAISLAQRYGCPIVNCDSRQIFKEMTIGTAVPTPDQLSLVKHYFIHSHSVKDYYTAGKYEIEALSLLKELFQVYDNVVMTGGSGLYIDALCDGLDDFPPANQVLREELMHRLESEGLESLQNQLKEIDPQSFETLEITNSQRVVRALEVTISTGRKFSSFKTNPSKKRDFDIEKIGLTRPREVLYDRINRRVDLMLEHGLVEEARELLPYRDMPALRTVGYKELFDFFDGKYDFEEAVRLIKRNTRHYAKRQLTYWVRDKSITWIEL